MIDLIPKKHRDYLLLKGISKTGVFMLRFCVLNYNLKLYRCHP